MLKFFLAEAVLSKHSAFVASADVDPQQLTKVCIETVLSVMVYICSWCIVYMTHRLGRRANSYTLKVMLDIVTL